MTTIPLTSVHLRQAIRLAEQSAASIAVPVTDGYRRRYDQSVWDCGTICCLHGFANLIGRGEPADHGPMQADYRDLDPVIRDGVLSVLNSSGGTPDLLRRVLDGDIVLGDSVAIYGPNVQIGTGVSLGEGTEIYDAAKIGDGVTVGNETQIGIAVEIGPGTEIGHYVSIGHNTIVGSGVQIADYVTIGSNAVIADGDIIDDDVD